MSRDLQKQRTKELILQTAQRLFQDQGYDKVSTRMIAKESGVAIGTVFSHFKDKQVLTQALFHDKIDARLAEHAPVLAQQETGLKYFTTFAEFFYEFYAEDRAFSVALMQNALFDLSYFEQQMEGFIRQVSERLQTDLTGKAEAQCYAVAKAWFGYYVFQLLKGLSTPDSQPTDWLAALTAECENLYQAVV
ncbi:TetR/AcrR family transcriptional regulator [Reinekea sp. G2M2-21]|uniref:TetR/AcrR family transcriptional regulator n=1 Tax=Reinekea sp. G2M2-21 TaxID=2788942 RepID=UPI0018AA0A7D|nr:TetR/AcrR family transcriptional regulator [Reinekea sp. G2M2-21]